MDDAPWRWVPRSEIRPVHPVAEQRARGLLRRWWDEWRGDRAAVASADVRTEPLATARLDALLPEPPSEAQQVALDAVREARTRAVLLRPEDRSWDAALAATPPPGGTLLSPPVEPPFAMDLPSDVRTRLADPAPVHLLRLERWFVRHHDGLAALRALLALLSRRREPWSLDVSVWTWAWLCDVLPEARALPEPHAPAPLHGAALAAWLGPLPEVRMRGSGESPGEGVFDALATRSRGAAGVARAVWRVCLRDGAERPEGEDQDGSEDRGAEPDAGAVWARHPSGVDLPEANGLTREDLIVLHTALVHGEPTAATMRRALPFGPGVTDGALAALCARDLLDLAEGGRYRLRAEAIPAVRGRLRAESFPTEPN